ncbi:uncharacterized protein LOC104855362 isoform X2 [Fukomys damarensis]|uniref:uncharacterized protein LOC104855362 isoform X2 n=1 Tax=Fukomys damarensis TaxID=885580 RepID=UPI00053F6A5D|nr:uncharacterized protein LOC104855362 isoform X2 [Fukomys damarensis]
MSLPSVFLMPLGLWLSFSPTQVQVGQISGSCDTWPGHWGALGQKTEELGALMSHLPHHPAVRSWLLEQSREDASGQEEEAYPVETEQGLAHPRALPQLAPVLCHWATPIFSTRAVPPSSRHPFLVFPFRLSESFCLPGTAILLPQPSQCLDYRCAPPRPASLLSFRCPKQRSQPEISRSPWAADPVPQPPTAARVPAHTRPEAESVGKAPGWFRSGLLLLQPSPDPDPLPCCPRRPCWLLCVTGKGVW